ncbi:MAG: primosomal protein N', partial [Eudoraea sp.]|nr:primosomal protein N' [Eudoraea sp.]
MEYFVDVILPIPLEKLFTYSVSEHTAMLMKKGMRVAVPFGKSKIYTALVYQVHSEPPKVYEAKEIHELIDTVPLVSHLQLDHWQWMARYYMCTLGEVFRTAVPSAFLLESETLVLKNNTIQPDESALNDHEFMVLEALEHQPSLKINDVSAILDKKTVLPLLNSMLRKKYILLKETLHEQYKPKQLRTVRLHDKFSSEDALSELLEELSRAPKQREVLLTLFQLQAMTKKPIPATELQNKSGASSAIIKTLKEKGILEEQLLVIDRVIFEGEEASMAGIKLSDFQKACLQQLRSSLVDKQVALLHGVTSSGKTEVYVKLMEEYLGQGKQVLYLLPEIALTTQLIERLQAYFGEKVAVFHSKYSQNERVEVWNNVLNNASKAQIVIGARSSLFLPFSKLGLVIIDEEHENSFKQYDPAPRYHARDSAIVLATLHNAKVILGSATPSLESYYNVQKGKYGYAFMDQRYGGVQLPEIELVDIKEASRKKRMKGHFSERLIGEISETLNLKEQVILFQNRRGYAPIVECTTCGHAPQCPNCDVSLTYHQSKKQLRCHYCGYHTVLE